MRAQRCVNSERGQALPLVSLVLVLAGATLVLVATIGQAVIQRARARTAADAAALAGATGGQAEADAMARANGAVLAEFNRDGTDASVEVFVGEARAVARARVDGPWGTEAIPPGGGDRVGLAPSMLAAVARADALLGRPVPVVSGYRSRAEQQALWDRRASNRYPVAPPGSSRHEHGLAIDVPASFVDDLLAVAAAVGLCQPMPVTDPVHFEQCPLTSPP
ncbi:MAG: M15 family metallopeptidase [Acidimicrobiales bacterium]